MKELFQQFKTLWEQALLQSGDWSLTWGKLVLFFLVILVTLLLTHLVILLFKQKVESHLKMNENLKKNIRRIIRIIFLITGITLGFQTIGINLQWISSFFNAINFKLFTIGETDIGLSNLITFILLISMFSIASRYLSNLLVKRGLANVQMETGRKYVLGRITQYSLVFIGLLIAFQTIGINLSGITVIFGMLSVGIGFGLQNITSNFISGLILLFEQPISVGDRITVGDIEGNVQEIKIRSTTITSLDNIAIIVPNSEFVSGRVINWSHGDRKIRMNLDVGVAYQSDVDKVMAALLEVADQHPKVLKKPEPKALLLNFGDSSLDCQLRVWLAHAKEYYEIKSSINREIVKKFREYNIEIPFPQRDLNFRNAMPGKTDDA